MLYAIVYSSRTGNTERLAQAIREALPTEECLYIGRPGEEARQAARQVQRVYVGFWTDRGSCDEETAGFLKDLTDQEVYLFGTAGFGGHRAYDDQVLQRVRMCLPAGVHPVGSFLCQGKMPLSVRKRYESLLRDGENPRIQAMIDNFDQAASHPDIQDLEHLQADVRKG